MRASLYVLLSELSSITLPLLNYVLKSLGFSASTKPIVIAEPWPLHRCKICSFHSRTPEKLSYEKSLRPDGGSM